MSRPGRSCPEARALLAAHALHDLPPLERAWIDAHLEHCAACADLRAELASGFAAARARVPAVDVEHLVTLVRAAAPGELGPVTGPLRPRRARPKPPSRVLALAAVAAALAVVVLRAPTADAPDSTTSVVPELPRDNPHAHPEPHAHELAGPAYHEPTSHLRMVTAGNWQGRTVVDDALVAVHMEAGDAGFLHVSGDGRRLHVRTPRGDIRAEGTRFALHVAADHVSVSVEEGVASVHAGPTLELVDEVPAGTALRVDDAGIHRLERAPVSVHAVLADPWLTTPRELQRLPTPVPASVASSMAPAAKAQARPAATKTADLDELLPRLEEAQRLGRAGERAAALARYGALEKDARFANHLDLIAYDRARLQGLVLGDVDDARRALVKLEARAKKSLATEAALTRCELDRARNACAAVECLDRLAASGGAAADDARRLRVRWRAGCAR